ncbi:hypothetical protein ACFYVR_24615 [Rhodococcus sp. NPDC003318]|uniref:hypothetical protein n=1 Tax=Rhodococcus sp. NPDC003318 TaxID=3364503 RepID=UPI0036AC3696
MSLRPAHHGYAYQDVLTAIYLVDVALRSANQIVVDKKLFDEDRFDDLTCTWRGGTRSRVQVKHTAEERELPLTSFTADKRSLRLDKLFASLDEDLSAHPGTSYRVVLRDIEPSDPDLTDILKPADGPTDPGPVIEGLKTSRYHFDADAILATARWQKKLALIDKDVVRRACAQLIVEVDMPSFSMNLREPGPLEEVLLRRVTDELGAGRPPNRRLDPETVAWSLIETAKAARTLNSTVTTQNLLPRLGLVVDFGAVRQGHPVDQSVEVARPGMVAEIYSAVTELAATGGSLVVAAGPGTGKSWLCEQLSDHLSAEWTVARHHCWLGAADEHRDDRVLSDVVIGSLIQQLESVCPESVDKIRPRYAATSETLSAVVDVIRQDHPFRPILLIVDGLDHVTRVRGRTGGAAFGNPGDPARALVDELAALKLPEGVVLVLASQPGDHLDFLAGRTISVAPLTRNEVGALVEQHGVLTEEDRSETLAPGSTRADAIIDLVYERSRGNALYATYLCRQAAGHDPLGRLREVPTSADDLDTYYRYLLDGLTEGQRMAVGLLAVCDFGVSVDELGEIFPFVAMIPAALETVAPIVIQQPGIGGLKIHHESFSRYIRDGTARKSLDDARAQAAEWLKDRGFFTDTRAFRHLPELLVDLERDDEISTLVGPDFVSRAIAGLQPPAAIKAALEVVSRRAAVTLDWRMLLRCTELRRSTGTYEFENVPDTLVDYGDVLVSLLGADEIATSLVYDGERTMEARWGLQLCAAVDRAGAAAPWGAYLTGWLETPNDNVAYGKDSDNEVRLAQLRAELRLSAQQSNDQEGQFTAEDIAGILADNELPLADVIDVLSDCFGPLLLMEAIPHITDGSARATLLLHLADLMTSSSSELPPAGDLACQAWDSAPGLDPRRALEHGVPIDKLVDVLFGDDVDGTLSAATDDVLTDPQPNLADAIRRWLDLITTAHAHDKHAPNRMLARVEGVGFFRAWLRFTIATVGLGSEVARGAIEPKTASATVRIALEQLAQNAEPFTGKPRACDLWGTHHHVHEVVEKAVTLLDDDDLEAAIGYLTATSAGTTTSAMGFAATGPLYITDLLAILSRTVDGAGAAIVHGLRQRLRNERAGQVPIYSERAKFELEMARISLYAGDRAEAGECWERAAHLLAGYGSHKDPTIYELIDPLPELRVADVERAQSCLARLQPLTYLVPKHTDGRDTSGTPHEWWRHLASLDPRAAADHAASILLTEPGLTDALVETAHLELLSEQADTSDPIILAALRIAAGSRGRNLKLDTALLGRLADLPVDDPARTCGALAVIANAITSTYDDMSLMPVSRTDDPHPGTDLDTAALALGGEGVRPHSVRKDPKSRLRPRSAGRSVLDILHARQRPSLPPGAVGAISAVREHVAGTRGESPYASGDNLDALVNAIGWRVVETALGETGPDAAVQLLHRIADELGSYHDPHVLVDIAEGLALRRDIDPDVFNRVAAVAFVLAFTRIRGRGGWFTFAGRDRLDLWRRALTLDANAAGSTLAGEITRTIAGEWHTTSGVTRAVVSAFAATHLESEILPTSGAFSCWDAAYEVIEHRLPGQTNLGVGTYQAPLRPATQEEIDHALGQLALSTLALPERGDRRRALVAATALAIRPDHLQSAATRVLTADIGSGPLAWLLATLRDLVSTTPLTAALLDQLTTLTGSDLLSVRVAAADILANAGRIPPAPPATPAHPELSRTLSTVEQGESS